MTGIKQLLRSTIILLSIIFAAVLLLADISVFVNPEKAWVFAFLGLAFLYLLIVNIIFAVYFAIRRDKFFLIPFIAILLSWNNISSTIQVSYFTSKKEKKYEKTGLKIMSYNVRGFNKYSWIAEENIDISILGLIKEENPDIVCFQEFYNSKNKKWQFKIKSWFRPKRFNKAFYKYSDRADDDYGIAVFSKYPIIKTGHVKFNESGNTGMYADIKIKKDTIRLYNIHLQSIQLVQENYDFIDTIGIQSDDQQEIKKISFKLREAYKQRANQVTRLTKLFDQSPYPIIVCGDFNDTPVSYTYKKLTSGLKDSFKESGKGLGCTYHGIFNIFRIDYILHSPKYKAIKYNTIEVGYSDHFPIVCKLVKTDL